MQWLEEMVRSGLDRGNAVIIETWDADLTSEDYGAPE